jgi:hypothetical protein
VTAIQKVIPLEIKTRAKKKASMKNSDFLILLASSSKETAGRLLIDFCLALDLDVLQHGQMKHHGCPSQLVAYLKVDVIHPADVMQSQKEHCLPWEDQL